MTFTVPNLPASPTTEQQYQSEIDNEDFGTLVNADAQTGVVTGCAVTQRGAGANMSVDVAAGVVTVNGVDVAVSATNVVIANGDATNPRFDMIVASALGVVSRVAGTAAAHPVFPALSSVQVPLAAVYVAANQSTSVVTADITDKRVLVATYLNGMPNVQPLADVQIGATQVLDVEQGLLVPAGVSIVVAAGGNIYCHHNNVLPWEAPWGLKGSASSDTTSAVFTTTETELLVIPGMRLRALRMYKIELSLRLTSTVAGDVVQVNIRNNLTGIYASFVTVAAAAGVVQFEGKMLWVLGVDGVVRLDATALRTAGTGNIQMQGSGFGIQSNWLTIEDVGPLNVAYAFTGWGDFAPTHGG